MNTKTRDCLIIMLVSFLADTLMFCAGVYHRVIVTDTHLYIASVITLIFLASYAGYLYHSRYPTATRARA